MKRTDKVPASEFSETFTQGMYDRMCVSFFKYGPVAHGFPEKLDALASLQLHLDAYAKDGNTEHMMDAANYAMIEFMRPRHPHAFFKATDSNASPGRRKADATGTITTKHNDDLR
jgi:hypothetical protein